MAPISQYGILKTGNEARLIVSQHSVLIIIHALVPDSRVMLHSEMRQETTLAQPSDRTLTSMTWPP